MPHSFWCKRILPARFIILFSSRLSGVFKVMVLSRRPRGPRQGRDSQRSWVCFSGAVRRIAATVCALLLLAVTSFAAEKQRVRVDDYDITAELLAKAHKLTARAQVKFTALDDISVATFELHDALRVTKVEDADGHSLSAERVTQDSTVRVLLPAGVS